ncbi:PAS domain S-box-containing protein [Saccharopolyspora antimicrobica]|uniref:histidine kinase n=1 Tax=Saccharopolyspora antimicrobica TaxID=455193 RepID=A0A1I5K5V7_9PSEU|nr:PAS domain-containing sensor histidine kinase [Saccharopolyspora antimicrobica]RKT84803.1 PAS domain S-box-containing protein [Saccharopolyspora antimicrobica]SFO80123.1 PAS domain S-box-containing protein [Saccharopolyspora antimicrobica]
MQVDPRAPELTAQDFVTMAHATRMCVLLHDAATKDILWANPAACEMLEWSVAELRPLKANDMSSSAQQYDRVIGRAWLQEAVDRGASRIEWHYRAKSGRVIPTDAVAVRVELERGPAVLVQFRDIEREQEVERQLRLTTSWVDALAHHTSTVALMLDAAGTIRFATNTALPLIGATAGEPLGPLTDHARLRLRGRVSTWDEVLSRADPVTSVQLEVDRPDQERVWLEGSLERLQESDGLLMILHDVSERVHGQVRREREMHRENYLARYTAMGDMAMAIAHELGQPLAAAANFLAGSRATAPADSRVGYGIDNAVRQIERAATIVSSVRAFVGHLEHVQQVADLNDILEECLYFVGLRAGPAGVEVRVDRSPEPVLVRCERVLTGQVVLNLCFNAIDEMAVCDPQRRQLTVTTRIDGDAGVLTVDDLGRGLRHDPFERTFTDKEHGSGIGLALSYRIITRQHGAIWGESRDEGGSRFGFSLPLAS